MEVPTNGWSFFRYQGAGAQATIQLEDQSLLQETRVLNLKVTPVPSTQPILINFVYGYGRLQHRTPFCHVPWYEVLAKQLAFPSASHTSTSNIFQIHDIHDLEVS